MKNEEEQDETAIGKLTRGLVDASMAYPVVVVLVLITSVIGGIIVMPWKVNGVPHRPVSVDAIPNIGQNIQIVSTPWKGRSPRDVEDQVTYPLSTALLGISNVKEIRSSSMFGMSFIFVVFQDGTDFYWARSRILEKLEALPADTLPDEVSPSLGPEATALGQVYWYTLEGRDRDGNSTGGWSQQELRSIQDWIVRYDLMATEGVAEVASIGGYEKQYQVDLDPEAMRAYNIRLEQVLNAIHESNRDVGAGTTEINRVEYVIRGLGYIESLEDIRKTAITSGEDGTPIFVEQVANVQTGPAVRRGVLSRGGEPATGGVVVTGQDANPREVLQRVHDEVDQLTASLPRKILIDDDVSEGEVNRWAEQEGVNAYKNGDINHDAFFSWMRDHPDKKLPSWARVSQVEVVPYYDRSNLINDVLGTLTEALKHQVLITIIVILLLVMHLRSSVLISSMLPVSILMTFLVMKWFSVGADVIAMAGIAISIGTVVAMGIIVSENILKRLDEKRKEESVFDSVRAAASEVGGAALTAILTTLISFLPVFFMIGVPGRLFFPLAFTKTVIMISAVLLAIMVLPPLAYMSFGGSDSGTLGHVSLGVLVIATGVLLWGMVSWIVGVVAGVVGLYTLMIPFCSQDVEEYVQRGVILLVAALLTYLLALIWMPLGLEAGTLANVVSVSLLVLVLMTGLAVVYWHYEALLRITLSFRFLFSMFILLFLIAGYMAWQDLGEEFRPDLEEGSFLYMPIMSYHGSAGEAIEGVQRTDRLIETIPEVKESVGKAGRVRSALDPAPLGMLETIVTYKSEFKEDEDGNVLRYQYNPDHPDAGDEGYVRDESGHLIRDPEGRPYRQWRDHIREPDDIWEEIVDVADLPGWTEPSKLQPIETRLLMLQTGLRAPIGVKVYSTDIQTAEDVAVEIERLLKDVPAVQSDTVQADRLVGKGYVEIDINRDEIARYGMTVEEVQRTIEVAIGGVKVTRTVEGRERYEVRVRYKRELRDSIDEIKNVLVSGANNRQVPLKQLADVHVRRGPQMIRGEDGRPVVYISFSQKDGIAEVNAVEQAKSYLREKMNQNQLVLPAGTSYQFAGSYQQQQKAEGVLSVLVPLSLLLIVVILYLQHKSLSTTLIVFSGIVVAWAGGFVLIWLYGQEWFLNVSLLGIDLRNLLNIQEYNLSIAVWVGFLVLFGIATDHGVLVATKLDQDFQDRTPDSPEAVRQVTVEAALQRIRPQIMMLGVTIFALLPVITSTGKGSSTMIPMALPSFGGMVSGLLTILIVPLLYANVKEFQLRSGWSENRTECVSVLSLFVVPVLYNEYCSVREDLFDITGGEEIDHDSKSEH